MLFWMPYFIDWHTYSWKQTLRIQEWVFALSHIFVTTEPNQTTSPSLQNNWLQLSRPHGRYYTNHWLSLTYCYCLYHIRVSRDKRNHKDRVIIGPNHKQQVKTIVSVDPQFISALLKLATSEFLSLYGSSRVIYCKEVWCIYNAYLTALSS